MDLRALVDVDVTVLDEAELREVLVEACRVRSVAAALELAVSRELTRRHAAGVGARAEVVVGSLLGKTEAARIAKRAEALIAAPTMEHALQAGAVTPTHVDVFAAALRQTPGLADLQVQIASAATEMSPDRFGEHVRRLAMLHADDGGIGELERQRAATRLRRWVDRFTGMYHVAGAFDPERGAQLAALIDREVEVHFHGGHGPDLDHDQRAAIALHRLCTSPSGDEGGGMPATLNVHIDERTLLHDLHEHTHLDLDGGGQLPVAPLRRLACEARIRPIVLGGGRDVIDIGRSRRLATATQRAALRAMHPTCAIPGCAVPFAHCEIHHVRWWRHGGPTDLANMAPLCSRHHHDTHEGGWQLTIGRGRTITWIPPPPRGPP